MKDKNGFFILLGLLIISFAFTQSTFFAFYDAYGIPFGKSDVDNYLVGVRDTEINYHFISNGGHILPALIPRLFMGMVSPEYFFTVVVPVFVWLVIPITILTFSLLVVNDIKISIAAVLLYSYATFATHVYLISSLWAQMFATEFAFLALIFYELAKIGKRLLILLACLMAFFTILSHTAGIGLILIYLLGEAIQKKNKYYFLFILFGGSLIVYILGHRLFANYPFDISIPYMLTVFASPFFWCLGFWGLLKCNGISRDLRKTIGFAALTIMLISPLFPLWRPLISVLPFFAIFAAKGLDDIIYRLKDDRLAFLLVVFLIVMFISYYFITLSAFLKAMLWEMTVEGGIHKGLPRDMDPEPFKRMFFGGVK